MRNRRGFSLFELMVVLGLGALLCFMAGLKLHGAAGRAGAHALAQLVAEDLRAARQEAIARRRPVALCFPSNSGALGHATACYVLEGEAAPRVTRVRSYAREFPQAQIFLGTWPTTTAASRNLPLPGSKWTAFKPDKWLPGPMKQDYCFIFMPDGSVRTNDLPAFDGAYHLAVTAGAQYAAGGDPGGAVTMSPAPNYFRLAKAGDSFTLTLSGSGAVSMSNGLVGQDGSVSTEGTLLSAAGAPPPELPPAASSAPELLGEPRIYPPQNPHLLPPDMEAVVTKDQFLSLEVIARSPTGDQLFCKWEVQADPGNSQPGEGTYSMQNFGGGGRMEWDANYDAGPGQPKGAWRAMWQWHPPPTAVPLDKYQLSCQVKNYDGGTVDAEVQHVEVIPPGRILFESNRTGTKTLFSMNEDGSQQQPYKSGIEPTATLNGSRVVVVRNGNLWLLFPNDPTTEVQLTTGGNKRIPAISPNGNWIAFRDTATDKIMVMKTEAGATPVELGSGPSPAPRRPGPDPVVTEKISWNRSGTAVAFNQGPAIFVRSVAAGPGGNPVPGPAPTVPFVAANEGGQGGDAVTSPSFSVGSDEMYVINNFHTTDYDPYMFKVDSAGHHNWNNVSVGIEEQMVERDPGGGPVVLQERQTAYPLAGNPQICQLNTAAGVGAPPRFLTRPVDGSNTRPVWTR